MHPELTLGSMPITGTIVTLSSYVAAHVAYFVIGTGLAIFLNVRQGLPARDTIGAFSIGVPAGVMGAHLLAVIENREYYRLHPQEILLVWRGSAIYGGLVTGIVAGELYIAWRGLPLRRFLDGCAPSMALGEAITRIGCFLAGCCYGRPTSSPLGVSFPPGSVVFSSQVEHGLIPWSGADASLPVHATQLYSAAFGFLLCIVLLAMVRRPRRFTGEVFCVFLCSYGVCRLGLFYLRADPGSQVLLGLYPSQIWSLGAVMISVILGAHWGRHAPSLSQLPSSGPQSMAFEARPGHHTASPARLVGVRGTVPATMRQLLRTREDS
jgi:phosphatidylglycerol---prolipoprotein diacylglyceryl transferase